jgi:hypothetical protein
MKQALGVFDEGVEVPGMTMLFMNSTADLTRGLAVVFYVYKYQGMPIHTESLLDTNPCSLVKGIWQ